MIARSHLGSAVGVWLALLSGWLLSTAPPAVAQSTVQPQPWWELYPQLAATLEDGTRFYLKRPNGDTIPAEWVSAGYEFTMSTDSTCVTGYTFTGCKLNGTRIALRHWKNRRAVNLDADILAYNSRTVNFTFAPGDTLSFYRELTWMDPRFNRQLLENYRSADTLTFAVELVRSSDSTRIALLDTIGIMPCAQSCTPAIHSMRPIMAHVQYVVPTSITGTSAFIRVRPWAGGNGEYYFTRKEMSSVALWRRLLDPYWTTYLSQWNAHQTSVLWKSVPNTAPAADTRLSVRHVSGERNAVMIEFGAAPDGGAASVVVYDATGKEVFTPFTSTASTGTTTLMHRFAESGLYVIALLHEGKIVRTEKITISK